jgi:hypothetical protein
MGKKSMIKTTVAMTVIAIAISAVPANSAIIEGYGSRTCANWIEVHQGPKTVDTIAADNWIFGYLDGLTKYMAADNQMRKLPPENLLKDVPTSKVLVDMDKLCRSDPLKTIEVAAARLVSQLIAQNVSGPTKDIGRILVPDTPSSPGPSR